MPATFAERSNAATFPVNRLAQTGGEDGIALEGGGWDRQVDQWDRIFRELEGVRNLQDDWDGLGAKAPAAPLLESAVELARILRAEIVRRRRALRPGLTGRFFLIGKTRQVTSTRKLRSLTWSNGCRRRQDNGHGIG